MYSIHYIVLGANHPSSQNLQPARVSGESHTGEELWVIHSSFYGNPLNQSLGLLGLRPPGVFLGYYKRNRKESLGLSLNNQEERNYTENTQIDVSKYSSAMILNTDIRWPWGNGIVGTSKHRHWGLRRHPWSSHFRKWLLIENVSVQSARPFPSVNNTLLCFFFPLRPLHFSYFSLLRNLKYLQCHNPV